MLAELIVALDVPSSDKISDILSVLPDEIVNYKVGLELYTSEGPAAMRPLLDAQKKVFLDLKLHDIPRTVARAVTSAGEHGISLLTVHASGGRAMLEAAATAAADLGDRAPKLIAVTTLTSLDDSDLKDLGIQRGVAEHTIALGKLAIESGIDGLVCSPREVAAFRTELGDDALLVTPGIRLADGELGDQKRVATPASAVADGSSYLVVGRPILQAHDPNAAATAILAEMSTASSL
jgi:orotidine-5'-phosphate decarboxylase